MSFLKKLFGSTPAPAETEAARSEERDFNTLRDDGVRAMQAGELPFAVRCFEHALALRPDDLPTLGYQAEAFLRMQEYEKALPHLTRLAEAEPRNVEVRLLLAQAQGRLNRWTEEATTAAALRTDYPDEPRAAYFGAEAARGQGDVFTAIALLTQVLADHADYAAARLLRARVLTDMGQWNEVLADTTILLDAPTADEDAHLLHADALAALGREEEAERAYQLTLQANPFSDEALLHLGRFYEQTARLDRALSLYDKIINLRPDFAEAYKQRGGVKHRLHDEAGAAEDLKRSLELKPELAAPLEGEFSNLENRINEQYRAANPYQF